MNQMDFNWLTVCASPIYPVWGKLGEISLILLIERQTDRRMDGQTEPRLTRLNKLSSKGISQWFLEEDERFKECSTPRLVRKEKEQTD